MMLWASSCMAVVLAQIEFESDATKSAAQALLGEIESAIEATAAFAVAGSTAGVNKVLWLT